MGNGYYAFAGSYADDLVENDIYVMVFNEKGDIVWEYTYKTSDEAEQVRSIAVTPDGRILVAGKLGEVLDDDGSFVYCFKPDIPFNTKKESKDILLSVYDKKDSKPVQATVIVKNKDNTMKEYKADVNGVVKIPAQSGEIQSIQIDALGYQSLTDVVSLPGEGVKQEFKYYLVRAEAGTSIVMKSVQFERGTTNLLPESYEELDKLFNFLKEHPEVKIELSGHTDNGGMPDANQLLSEQRVAAVKDYLVKKGIAANRITGKGYGGKKPIAPNNSEENKAKNRRVEVKIL